MKRMQLVLLLVVCCSFIVNTVGLFAESLPERAITTFPHLQGFDSAAFPPPEWTNVKTAGLGEPGTWDWQTMGTNPTCLPYSGAGMARYNSADLTIGTRGELITPPLVIEDETVYKATFRMFRDDGYPANYDRVYVHLNSSPTSAGGEQLLLVNRYYGLQPAVSVPNQWYEYTVLFSTVTFASPVYLVFEGYSGNGATLGSNIYLDELTIAEATSPSFSSGLSNWNFGNVILGQTATKQITLTNTGDGPGFIHSISATGTGFSVIDDPTPVEVQPGGSISFTVQFQPTQYAVHYGQVNYTCDLGYEYLIASYDINLTGTGYFPAINTFPWSEDFECSVFPPPGWTSYDLDESGTFWVSSTDQNHTPGGTISALHVASDSVPLQDGGQSGWLVSPPIQIPPMGGELALCFWSYNANPQNYQDNNRIWVSTGSSDPDIGPYQEYECIQTVYDHWTYNQLFTLWFYEYQTIHIAFKYSGCEADDWYLDDVSLRIPEMAFPEITHLPLLNTPRTDIPYTVQAVTMEPDHPVATVFLHYARNSGDVNTVRMTPLAGDSFVADIPPQPLNSQMEYYFEVLVEDCYPWFSQPYLFTVNDPVWVRYDSGMLNGYDAGYDTYGVANIYENPFYGTDIPMKINAVYGELDAPGAATLEIYSYHIPTMPELLHSEQVYFEGGTNVFDLSHLQITTFDPYINVGFHNISPLKSFGYDDTRNYGQSRLYLGGSVLSVTGKVWYLGVNIGSYIEPSDNLPPIITHIPLLNNPRTDIPYRVVANIVDDPIFNNNITHANLYYLPGPGDYMEVPMTNQGNNTYYADIPPQPLGTFMDYYIMAWDSQSNEAQTDAYFFYVEDPTWFTYYGEIDLDYYGMDTESYTAFSIYENPYYGTGTPLAVYGATGMMSDNAVAYLTLYDYDGFGQIYSVFNYPVQFNANTLMTFDVSAHNVQINRQYLVVAYSGIVPGIGFGIDSTRDYGQSYLMTDSGMPEQIPGASWVIGALVGAGSLSLQAPAVELHRFETGEIVVNWQSIPSANNYRVYGTDNPYDGQSWNLLAVTEETEYQDDGLESRQFFRVIADTEMPRAGAQSGFNLPDSTLENLIKKSK